MHHVTVDGFAINSRHGSVLRLTFSAFTNLFAVTWVRAPCPDVVMQPFCRCSARVICRNGRR